MEFHRGEDGEFVVIDVGSLNGTYVNRQPVDEAVLDVGDEMQIGKFRLIFQTGAASGERRCDSIALPYAHPFRRQTFVTTARWSAVARDLGDGHV